jgi:catechol 2,3-dioxygenase-like lactoylglutathione lyase family enzyme
MFAPRALDHVGITVPDIDAGVAWYRDTLGFYVLMEPIEAVGDDSHFGEICRDIFGENFKSMKLAHLATADGVGVELFQFTDPGNKEPRAPFDYWNTGIFHIAVSDPDIEGLVERIVKSGGKQHSKVWQIWPDKDYKVCYCMDPWDNVVEISSHPYTVTWSNFLKPHTP